MIVNRPQFNGHLNRQLNSQFNWPIKLPIKLPIELLIGLQVLHVCSWFLRSFCRFEVREAAMLCAVASAVAAAAADPTRLVFSWRSAAE